MSELPTLDWLREVVRLGREGGVTRLRVGDLEVEFPQAVGPAPAAAKINEAAEALRMAELLGLGGEAPTEEDLLNWSAPPDAGPAAAAAGEGEPRGRGARRRR